MHKIFFIVGACASGKTLAIEGIEKRLPKTFAYCYYDTLGTPTDEEVYRAYGTWDEWHKHLTDVWVKRIKERYLKKKPALLDTQARPDVIESICRAYGIKSYEIILLECGFKERKRRLMERKAPHIVNQTLEDWVRFLFDEIKKRRYLVLDNTDLAPEETRDILIAHMMKSVGKPKARRLKAVKQKQSKARLF